MRALLAEEAGGTALPVAGLPRACTRLLIGTEYSAYLESRPRIGRALLLRPLPLINRSLFHRRLLRPLRVALRQGDAVACTASGSPMRRPTRPPCIRGDTNPSSQPWKLEPAAQRARARSRVIRSRHARRRALGRVHGRSRARRAPCTVIAVYDAHRPWQRRVVAGGRSRGVSDSRSSRSRSVPTGRDPCAARSGAACSRSCSCIAARWCRPTGSSTRWPTAMRAAGRPARSRPTSRSSASCCRLVGAELITQPSGYVFDLHDDTLDAARFESMVRAASAEPDRGSRLRLLDGALGLWRGAALEEFSWPWAVTERARLDRRRLDALCAAGRDAARSR